MNIAFETYFSEIKKLSNPVLQHRAWLKDYKGLYYSIALEKADKVKWQQERDKYVYSDNKYSTEINKIQRHPQRIIIEFDNSPEENLSHIEKIEKWLQENEIGYIKSSHQGKSPYIWVEFNRNLSSKEAKSFLIYLADKIIQGSCLIDLNFASDNRRFPILFAIHWKHSEHREMPIFDFEGKQIDFDSLNIKTIDKLFKGKIIQRKDGYSNYETKEALEEGIFKPQGQVKFYIQEQPIFYDKNCLWWAWNKNLFKWEISDEVDILNHIEKITGEDIINPKNRTLILNSLKQECRKTIPLPIEKTWIQFKNQIYNFKTGEIFSATPDYFTTNPIHYELPKENYVETPVIDKIFEEWVGPNHVKTLYEIIAYCLLPDYPLHRLFCFLGSGMNGKSKFLELLMNFIGKDNCCATELDTLLSSRFEITKLHKKLVCLMGETNFNELSKTSTLKKLTGQDLIGFEYKNKTPFEDKNYAKILIATNNLPETTDKTIGFYRRWCIIDFPNRFSEEKDILLDIPEEEYKCLALKSVMLLKDILEARKFTNEGTLEERERRYEEKSNPLDKFMKEFCVLEDPNGYILKFEFIKKFNSWCKENRFREFSEESIGRKMKTKEIEIIKVHVNWINDGNGGQLRAWGGIKWKD
jgi:P4 family phage/plasmid primase-like protien